MKTVKLEKVKPIKRLIDLVDKIPELVIDCNAVSFKTESELYMIYDIPNNSIAFYSNQDLGELYPTGYEYNPLLNKQLLEEALNNDITHITQDQFCDVLEQHLYLKAKQKFKEILPQQQKRFPDAKIMELDELNVILMISGGETIVKYELCKIHLNKKLM